MTPRLYFVRPGRTLGFVLLVILSISPRLFAAEFATQNFVVTAETAAFARQTAETAEQCRHDLALLWLGVELPRWSAPCPIRVKAAPNLGAGGETSFTFKGNEVFGWKMKVQGTEERILDSVIPHEISHMILATCFRRPVPRWIDEGAATSIEADAERSNYRRMLVGFLREQKGLPFNTMVRLKEYPADMMPFYAQGFSVCEYLIAVGGHRRLVEFARAGISTGNWSAAVNKFYGYQDLSDLQLKWQAWVSEWYHQNMPAELPQVASIGNYNYDIYGRPMTSGTLVASNAAPRAALTPVPTASLPMPQSPQALAYQGSYGRMTPTAAPGRNLELASAPRQTAAPLAPGMNTDKRSAPAPAPALDFGSAPIMLGQERK